MIRAAERCRSPAVIQLFPWSMHFQGPAFVKYVSEMAQAASVPISIHLDHCLKPSDADIALECAFDSIMVDGSMFEEEENIKYVRSVVERARVKNITIEAELGRMEGGEDGIPFLELESVLTKPEHAAWFVKETGTHYLAPSFGNVHGPYGPGGAEKYWQLDRYTFPARCSKLSIIVLLLIRLSHVDLQKSTKRLAPTFPLFSMERIRFQTSLFNNP